MNARADVNLPQKDGRTPLMKATERGHPPVARILIAAGAELNARDTYGKTAVTYAKDKRQGNPEIAQMLLVAGANDR